MAKKRNITEAVVQGPVRVQKRRVSSAPPRLADATLSSAVNALLKDYDFHERKRAKRSAARGKVIGDLIDTEVFVWLIVTFKEAPFKDRLRPYAVYVRVGHISVLYNVCLAQNLF